MPMFNDDWFLCRQCNNILEYRARIRRRIFIESHRVCSFDWEKMIVENVHQRMKLNACDMTGWSPS